MVGTVGEVRVVMVGQRGKVMERVVTEQGRWVRVVRMGLGIVMFSWTEWKWQQLEVVEKRGGWDQKEQLRQQPRPTERVVEEEAAAEMVVRVVVWVGQERVEEETKMKGKVGTPE